MEQIAQSFLHSTRYFLMRPPLPPQIVQQSCLIKNFQKKVERVDSPELLPDLQMHSRQSAQPLGRLLNLQMLMRLMVLSLLNGSHFYCCLNISFWNVYQLSIRSFHSDHCACARRSCDSTRILRSLYLCTTLIRYRGINSACIS